MNASKIVICLGVFVAGFALWTIFLMAHPASQTPKEEAAPTPTIISQTQTNEEGNVSVSVTPLELAKGKPAKFQIALNTHSVSLDFDIATVTSLVDNNGKSYGRPEWDGSPAGGHHRSGNLTFSQPINGSAKKLSLTFKDIAGIAVRTFEEEVKY